MLISTIIKKNKIKPCPLCGKEPEFHDKYKYSIICSNHSCIMRSPVMIYKNKKLAISAWNQRT